jgi:quercetin dioxygenase-like cupin family protein
MEDKQLIITGPEEGDNILVAGSRYRIVLSGEQTNGESAVIEMNVPPGSGPIPHEHPSFRESFYVLEGEVEMRTATGRYLAKQGAIVTIPLDGPVHAFKNVSDKMAKLLCIVTPAGLDAFFCEAGRPYVEGAAPQPITDEDKKRIGALAEKYGQKLYPPDVFDK